MSPETRAFLELVRGAEEPTPGDERRVLDAIRAAVAAETPLAASGGAAKATTGLVLTKGSGLKLLGALVAVSAGVTRCCHSWPRATAARGPLPAPLRVAESATVPTAPLPSATAQAVAEPADSRTHSSCQGTTVGEPAQGARPARRRSGGARARGRRDGAAPPRRARHRRSTIHRRAPRGSHSCPVRARTGPGRAGRRRGLFARKPRFRPAHGRRTLLRRNEIDRRSLISTPKTARAAM